VLLALAIVISMLMVRGLHLLGPTPAGRHGVIPCAPVKDDGANRQPAAALPESVATNDPRAAVPISAAEFEATRLNSPSLITPLHVESKRAGFDVILVGAYADSARLVLIYHVLATDLMPYPIFSFYDGQESVVAYPAGESGGEVAPGDFVEQIDAGPRASAGRIAHLIAYPPFGVPAGNPAAAVPLWKFDLPVQRSICYSTGAPFQLGPWPVSITMLEVTPSTLHIRALVVGASGPAEGAAVQGTINDPELLTAVDQNGTTLGGVAGGGVSAEGGWLIDDQWMRPAGAGSYRLIFKANGVTHTVTLDAPASAAI
jgi:energy-converting hydrogenase Eha subunit B